MSKLLERDIATAMPLVEEAVRHGGILRREDRRTLVDIIRVSYHDDGKIEGANSIDSCASTCEFCQRMRKHAKNNPDHICAHCYACRGYMSWRNVRNRHELNMVILSKVEFDVDDFAYMVRPGILRFDADGDFANTTHAGNAIKIATANPPAASALWAKNWLAVQEAEYKYGKPANLICIASSILINKAIRCPDGFDYTFTVYRTEEDVRKAIAEGSVECNGRKCMDDGFGCYFGKWPKGSNIAELLR